MSYVPVPPLCVGVMLFKAWKIGKEGGRAGRAELDGEIQLIPSTISCLNALAARRHNIKGEDGVG